MQKKLYDHYLIEDHELVTDTLHTLHELSLQAITAGTTAEFKDVPALQLRLHTALTTLQALHHKKTQRDEIERAEPIRRHMF